MGHVQPGGEAAAALTRPLKVRRGPPAPLAGAPVWGLFEELLTLFPLWRSIVGRARMGRIFNRETSWWRFDVVRGLRSLPSSLAMAERLGGVDTATLDAVIGLAEVNSRRQEHFFRTLVLAYVTVPLTLAALVAQLSPGALRDSLADPRLTGVWAGLIAGLATAVAVRFVADWRARAFLAVLQMIRLERSISPAAPPPAARNKSGRPRSPRA